MMVLVIVINNIFVLFFEDLSIYNNNNERII